MTHLLSWGTDSAQLSSSNTDKIWLPAELFVASHSAQDNSDFTT